MGEPKADFMIAMQKLAYEKSISNITVEDICQTAGYSRQTFYRYFIDKYDLVFAVYEHDISIELAKLDDVWNFSEHCNVVLSCFADNNSFYKKAFKKSSFPSSFRNQFEECSINYTIEAIGKHRLSKDQKLLIQYWVSNTVSMIEKWLMSGMEEDTSWLISMFIRLMPSEVKELYLS